MKTLLPDRLQMLLYDDVVDIQNDEASENKKIKKIKIRFTYSVLACAETPFA